MINSVKGKEWRDIENDPFYYTGEVDLSGNICGFGTAISAEYPYNPKCEGTFYNGKKHGFGG